MRYNLLLYTFTYRRFYLDHSMYIFPNHVAIKLMGHSILIILFRINFHCPNYGVYIIFTHKCLISEKGLTICKIIKSLKIYKQICKFHTLEQFKYLHTWKIGELNEKVIWSFYKVNLENYKRKSGPYKLIRELNKITCQGTSSSLLQLAKVSKLKIRIQFFTILGGCAGYSKTKPNYALIIYNFKLQYKMTMYELFRKWGCWLWYFLVWIVALLVSSSLFIPWNPVIFESCFIWPFKHICNIFVICFQH